ncbi:MAG: ABC transporter substrate-binding protein [Chloroflexi bacterium]|nr:ABC transporter substrate-binding protein [Chloroflexota bacterium]
MLKNRVLLMVIISALLLSLIIPACTATKADVIKIGVSGPMKFLEGQHHWIGASLARDEINAAGGVSLNGKKYQIELIKSDNNEILSPTDATASMERLITVDKPDFIMGGFRTESVFPMQDVAMKYKKIFFNCGAATRALQAKVETDYAKYKYFFKITPYNEYYLVTSDYKMLNMVAAKMVKDLGLTGKLRVAIVAEKLTWADAMVTSAQDTLPKLGMEVTGVWRPSDTATDVNAELTAIAATNPHIIFPTFSGPVGVTFGKQAGELQIPAAIVGIVVEAQKKGYWEATGGKGNYIMTLNTYAKGVKITDKTIPFFEGVEKATGEYPAYTAATYDAVYIIKEAVEKAQSLDPDTLVPLFEKTEYLGTAGLIKYYQAGPDTKAPACVHDIQYGPGLVTGIGTQWQDGQLKGVWPAKGYGSGGWENIDYPGIVPYVIPPAVVNKYKAK